MDDWVVILRGDARDLEDLSKVFTTPDLTIKKVVEKDYQFYSLTTPQFTPVSPYKFVKDESEKITEKLTALIKLHWDSRKPIEIDCIRQYQSDGKIAVFLEGKCSASSRGRASLQIVKKDGSVEISDPADPLRTLMKIAQKDAKVAKAFHFFSIVSNPWYDFPKILEIMEEDQFKPIMRGGIHRKKAKKLTATANCELAIGSEARHAKESIPRPKDPMSLSEARSFIKMLLHEWLKEKESKNNV
jgi:hypothetical protein